MYGVKLSPIAHASSSAAYSDCISSLVRKKSPLLGSCDLLLCVHRMRVDIFACFHSSIGHQQIKSVYGQCLSSKGMKRSESLNSLYTT